MNNNQYYFGLYGFHHFNSRILFLSNDVAFLEWVREAAPEYELRISGNLASTDQWPALTASDYTNYEIHGHGKIIHNPNVDDATKFMHNVCVSWNKHYMFFLSRINHLRKHVGTAQNYNFQSLIYQQKLQEAQDIKKGLVKNLKFLNVESIYKGLTLDEMADRVILENDLFMGYLARTEFLRIKWLGKLKTSRDVLEHDNFRSEFLKEMYEYHQLS